MRREGRGEGRRQRKKGRKERWGTERQRKGRRKGNVNRETFDRILDKVQKHYTGKETNPKKKKNSQLSSSDITREKMTYNSLRE